MFWSLGALFLKEEGFCDFSKKYFLHPFWEKNIFQERIFTAMCQVEKSFEAK